MFYGADELLARARLRTLDSLKTLEMQRPFGVVGRLRGSRWDEPALTEGIPRKLGSYHWEKVEKVVMIKRIRIVINNHNSYLRLKFYKLCGTILVRRMIWLRKSRLNSSR